MNIASIQKTIEGIDRNIFFAVLFLLLLGILMVFSSTVLSSAHPSSFNYKLVFKHLLSIVVGFVALILGLQLKYTTIIKYGWIALPLSILLLVLLYIPGLGRTVNGATRWISFGEFYVQPGEFVKPLCVIYFASWIARKGENINNWNFGFLVPGLILGIVSILFLGLPDFGTAAIVVIAVGVQLFIVLNPRFIIAFTVASSFALGFMAMAEPYRWKRLQAFMDPWKDPLGDGYQLIQSLIAIGSGGIQGEGLGSGTQKLYYLPAAHNDFIFSVIAEETGFIGTFGLLMVILFLVWRMFRLCWKVRLREEICVYICGLSCLIILPMLLNMGIALGLLPTKGLVFPLVSYGGSAMISSLFTIGLLLSMSKDV